MHGMQEVGGSIPPGSTTISSASPSSRGPGHRPFTAVTGVRIPLGTPQPTPRARWDAEAGREACFFSFSPPCYLISSPRDYIRPANRRPQAANRRTALSSWCQQLWRWLLLAPSDRIGPSCYRIVSPSDRIGPSCCRIVSACSSEPSVRSLQQPANGRPTVFRCATLSVSKCIAPWSCRQSSA